MKEIPKTKDSLVLRTDFTDEAAWKSICKEIEKPNDHEFRAYVEFVSDPQYDGITAKQLARMKKSSDHLFIFVVDSISLSNPEHPILVVDLIDKLGRTFRVIPSQMWSVENNLSIANMDFHEFADAAGDDGIYRGFKNA